MATLINDGWLYLSNGTDIMKLPIRTIKWDVVMNPEFYHQVGFNFGFDIGEEYMIFKVSGLLLDTNAKKDLFELNLRSWQTTAPFTLKVQRTKAGAFEKIDGTNTQYIVLAQTGWKDATKISPEDGEVYEIGKISFEEAGVRAA